jgi:hypothetical protein
MLLLAGIVYADPLEALYVRATLVPRLQEEFGFEAVTLCDRNCDCTSLIISQLAPTGKLARAGVRLGDRPWDYHGREEITFFRHLDEARRREVTVPLLRRSQAHPAVEFDHVSIRLGVSAPPN